MAQMHSFLVENAKSELNYVNQNLRDENFLLMFSKIASFMENSTNLFDSDSVSSENLVKNAEDDIEESSKEVNNSVGKNSLNLEIGNLILLSSKLESNESLSEDIVHKDKDFD
ncbi:23795_t:CDS:1, partial [Cetraspora pellucida]